MSILKASVRLKVTHEELLASVKKYADEHPDKKWLRPVGPCLLRETKDHKMLSPDRLLWFESDTAHDFWLNSKALDVDKN